MNIWSSTKIDPPTDAFRKASGEKAFAEGKAEAILAKGGPEGVFLWAHLHGVHDGHQGKSHYTVTVTVRDESGFPYMLTPALTKTVEGVLDKPEQHKHYYGVFTPELEVADVLKNNDNFIINVIGNRERNDWQWLLGEFKEIFSDISEDLVKGFIDGKVSPSEMLKALQVGKTPLFS